MSTRRGRVRIALPSIVPALLILALELIVVVVVLAWRQQDHRLCVQFQKGRVSANITIRDPLRQFARDAASDRAARSTLETGEQRRGDLATAAAYRRIEARIHDLPPIKC